MREIFFRGKIKNSDKWVSGHNFLRTQERDNCGIMVNKVFIVPTQTAIAGLQFEENNFITMMIPFYEVDPETVGQFTGLYDATPWEELTTDEQALFLYPENGDKRSKEDWKGRRIFEGDICRFREWNNGEMCWIGKVHYEHQQFVISGNKNKECETPFTLAMSRFISKNIEVIGNIHDNPELLEVTK